MPPGKRGPESTEERFWRRERLTRKFKGAVKGSHVLRRGRIRPDRSAYWLAEAKERLTAIIAKRLAKPSRDLRKALVEKETTTHKIEVFHPDTAYHEVLWNYLKIERLALAANIAETNYLSAVWREMRKKNIPLKPIAQKRMQRLFNSRKTIKENIESLRQLFGIKKAEFRKQFREVGKLIKKDKQYNELYNHAINSQNALRKILTGSQGRAILDLVALEFGIKKPEHIKERGMRDAVAVTQQRINCAKAEIKVINRYLEFLQTFAKEFNALERAIRSWRKRREKELYLYESQLKECEAWWYGKIGFVKPD